jgi:hypothetical protein
VADDRKDKTSSIVMRAIDASTFTELQAFTKDLESRPIERLLQDVVELVKPSESKAQLVSYVIATKYRKCDEAARQKIMASLEATLKDFPAGEQRKRLEFIVDRLRTHGGE